MLVIVKKKVYLNDFGLCDVGEQLDLPEAVVDQFGDNYFEHETAVVEDTAADEVVEDTAEETAVDEKPKRSTRKKSE